MRRISPLHTVPPRAARCSHNTATPHGHGECWQVPAGETRGRGWAAAERATCSAKQRQLCCCCCCCSAVEDNTSAPRGQRDGSRRGATDVMRHGAAAWTSSGSSVRCSLVIILLLYQRMVYVVWARGAYVYMQPLVSGLLSWWWVELWFSRGCLCFQRFMNWINVYKLIIN